MVYPETVPRGVQVTCCWPGMRWKWSTASSSFKKWRWSFWRSKTLTTRPVQTPLFGFWCHFWKWGPDWTASQSELLVPPSQGVPGGSRERRTAAVQSCCHHRRVGGVLSDDSAGGHPWTLRHQCCTPTSTLVTPSFFEAYGGAITWRGSLGK